MSPECDIFSKEKLRTAVVVLYLLWLHDDLSSHYIYSCKFIFLSSVS